MPQPHYVRLKTLERLSPKRTQSDSLCTCLGQGNHAHERTNNFAHLALLRRRLLEVGRRCAGPQGPAPAARLAFSFTLDLAPRPMGSAPIDGLADILLQL